MRGLKAPSRTLTKTPHFPLHLVLMVRKAPNFLEIHYPILPAHMSLSPSLPLATLCQHSHLERKEPSSKPNKNRHRSRSCPGSNHLQSGRDPGWSSHSRRTCRIPQRNMRCSLECRLSHYRTFLHSGTLLRGGLGERRPSTSRRTFSVHTSRCIPVV